MLVVTTDFTECLVHYLKLLFDYFQIEIKLTYGL